MKFSHFIFDSLVVSTFCPECGKLQCFAIGQIMLDDSLSKEQRYEYLSRSRYCMNCSLDFLIKLKEKCESSNANE